MLTRIHPETGRRKKASNKIRDIWHKIGQYLIQYKEKCERTVKKSDERDEERARVDGTENVIENIRI
jgi:hypothetical protein